MLDELLFEDISFSTKIVLAGFILLAPVLYASDSIVNYAIANFAILHFLF
jgi:hypothetical protein